MEEEDRKAPINDHPRAIPLRCVPLLGVYRAIRFVFQCSAISHLTSPCDCLAAPSATPPTGGSGPLRTRRGGLLPLLTSPFLSPAAATAYPGTRRLPPSASPDAAWARLLKPSAGGLGSSAEEDAALAEALARRNDFFGPRQGHAPTPPRLGHSHLVSRNPSPHACLLMLHVRCLAATSTSRLGAIPSLLHLVVHTGQRVTCTLVLGLVGRNGFS